MDIILLVFFVSILISIRHRDYESDVLSVGALLPVRGIMAIAIILHHMSEYTNDGYLFPFMQHMGYLIVAVFFFLSGYGLMVSYQNKGRRYLRGFWKNRIIYMCEIYAFTTLVYSCYHIVVGDFIPSVTIVANSWYMVVQIILYAIFWFAFAIAGEKNYIGIVLVFILQTVMAIYMMYIELSGIWFISNYAFLFGIIVAKQARRLYDIVQKRFILITLGVITAFILFSVLPTTMNMGYDFCRMISTICFTMLVILICNKITVKSKMWSWLGKISLEIYLYHGLVYLALRRFIVNDVLWVLLTVTLTIPIAYIAFLVNTKIKRLTRK